MLWTFDKLVVPTGLVAALIRIGNLINHEVYGLPTDRPWGFRFIENLHAWRQGAEPIFSAPSHPTQIYEAVCYLLTFVLCMWLYFKKDAWKKEGLIFGIFMICIFTARFFIEFLKNNQEDFEAAMPINMGQCLSIPFIVTGAGIRKGVLSAESAGSQIDILPTLFELIAPKGFAYSAIGTSLTQNTQGVNYGFWITRHAIGKADTAPLVPESLTGGEPPAIDDAALQDYMDAVRSISWWRAKYGNILDDRILEEKGR